MFKGTKEHVSQLAKQHGQHMEARPVRCQNHTFRMDLDKVMCLNCCTLGPPTRYNLISSVGGTCPLEQQAYLTLPSRSRKT